MSMTLRNGDGGERRRTVVSCQLKNRRPTTDRLPPTAYSAFTLVEMLVVITIIGVLVALASVAAYKALEAAKKARIKAEVTNLESAIQQYKTQYSDYPPSNMADPVAIARHLAKAFPRCDPATEMSYIPKLDGTKYPAASGYTGISAMTPAQALVFWLSSLSKDPVHPISAKTADRNTLFDFDKTRLDTSAVSGSPAPGWYLDASKSPYYVPAFYKPQGGGGKGYIYFEAKSYLTHAIDPSGVAAGIVPYLLEPWDVNNNGSLDAGTSGPPTNDVLVDGSGNWTPASFQKLCANPKSFQIISAGLDGDYGVPSSATVTAKYNGTSYPFKYKSYPSGTGYDTSGADDDNITNFSKGTALGDDKP